MRKVALVTGVTGQDGSYLAELLISKGYEVHGLIRRSSTSNTSRIADMDIQLHFSDLTETANLVDIMYTLNPDEIYALGAQSHVKISFEVPVYTADVTGIGTLRLLEAMRKACPKARFYQAGSSEQFGSAGYPQNEETLFQPESPYACAKIFAYNMVHVYRKAYGLFAANGLLFNHESILYESPLIIRDNENMIDILPIGDMFKLHRWEGILDYYKGCKIWNGTEYTTIINGTSYKQKDKNMKLIQTVGSCYEATLDHVAFDENDKEVYTSDWKEGDKVFNVSYPLQDNNFLGEDKLASFLGFICGDGYISEGTEIKLTGCNREELIYFGNIFFNLYGIKYKLTNKGTGQYENCTNDIWSLTFNCPKTLTQWLRSLIYTKNKEKRVPQYILNSSIETKKAFFDGYYSADGRKKGNETYKYKGFTTSSATLCLGLIYIFKSFSNQIPKVKCEYRDGKRYYYTSFTTDKTDCKFGKNATKHKNEIVKITDTTGDEFFDIQTESKTFATGPNLFKVHNSERRGENFVTRKITRAATRIKLGLQEKLTLGNIDAYRDWGHSKDYCIDLDTKILTNNGFKTRNEISIGDNIINYNLQTDKWENDIIDDIYDIEYEGEMYTFNGNGFSFRASKNHRILYQTKTKDSHHWSNWKESTSSEIYEKFKDISLRTKYDYRFPGFTGIDSNGYDIEDNIITLLGYMVTEGCLYKSKTIGGGMTLSISQSNKKYLNDLIKCIDALNLTYNIYEREDGVYEIKFSSDSRDTILEYFDGYDVHTLPSYVYSFSQKQALLLFETMMNCDGCWSAMSYCSKKYKLAQQFSDIANYAGYRTKISQRKSGIYNVSVFSHAKKSVYQYVTDISKEQTSENIWCIKAKKNNTIITQKNKSTFISGNCRAMWMMLQHSEPDDFVVCSGESHSVREFLEIAFSKLDLDPYKYTEIDKSLFRPSEVDHLRGDCSKIKRILGWEPEISFDGLVTAMINHDMELAKKELKMIGG